MVSIHYQTDRQAREILIQKIGYGEPVKSIIVDRGHYNGPEIHTISSTGIITIQNQRTKKIVTRLIARPGQIMRYYKSNECVPEMLIQIAYEHLKMQYNEY